MSRLAIALCGGALLAIHAGAAHGSPAPPEFAINPPLLAERAIDRDWGPSDDSLYTEVDIPGWREEGLAMGMSAVVPGAGQWYAGSSRWWWFATAEVVGWTALALNHSSAEDFRDNAAGYAGNPEDPASNWSLDRYAAATGQDPAEIRRLYQGDREAFYDLIGKDDRVVAGWTGNPSATRTYFADQRQLSEDRLEATHWASSLLWINHMLAAWDALRAARNHNASLPSGATLKIETGWKHGDPTMKLAVEKKF